MSKERFEWIYNEKVLKHYILDNLNNEQLGYESIVNLLNKQDQQITDLEAKLAELEQKNDKLGTQLCNAGALISYLEKEGRKADIEIDQLKQQHKLLLADLNDAIKYIEIYNEKKNIGYYNTCLYHLDMIKKKLQENNDEKL